MHVYARVLPSDRVLFWYLEPTGPYRDSPHLIFEMIDLCALRNLPSVRDACDSLEGRESRLIAAAGALHTMRLPTSLPPGEHRVDLPEWLHVAEELLVLVDGTWAKPRRWPCLCIWAIRPAHGFIEVLPQEWFNRGDFEFSYEWITRVARDPNGRIIGDGIYLRSFRLDASGTRLDAWLDETPLPI
jgi:hypothetical protein